MPWDGVVPEIYTSQDRTVDGIVKAMVRRFKVTWCFGGSSSTAFQVDQMNIQVLRFWYVTLKKCYNRSYLLFNVDLASIINGYFLFYLLFSLSFGYWGINKIERAKLAEIL
jgi:hypothetical protein